MTISELAQRFVNGGTTGNVHNAEIYGNEYVLHGNVICKRIKGFNGTEYHFNWCNWYTLTTANHINYLINATGTNRRVGYAAARDSRVTEFIIKE